MSGSTIAELCQRVRPGLACVGELGQPLLERSAGTRHTRARAASVADGGGTEAIRSCQPGVESPHASSWSQSSLRKYSQSVTMPTA